MSSHQRFGYRCRCERVCLDEDLQLCLVNLADDDLCTATFRSRMDLDEDVFWEGQVSGVSNLDVNQ